MDTPVVKYNGSELNSSDYSITYYNSNKTEITIDDIKDAGTYYGKISASTFNLKCSKEFTYIINKAPLVVKDLEVISKTYDGTTRIELKGNSSYGTGIKEETINISDTYGTVTSANVGTDKVVSIANDSSKVSANSGTNLNNYTISFGTTKGTITQKDLSSLTAIYYNNTTSLSKTYSGTDISGTITVKNNGTLMSSNDYTLTYYNSSNTKINVNEVKNAGTYYIEATFKNNYKGSIKSQYVINKMSITPSLTATKRYDNTTTATISNQAFYTGISENIYI